MNKYTISSFELVAEMGRAYREYRRSLKLSQKDVHDKTGVAMSTISAFENGKGQGLSLAHFASLMDAISLRDGIQDLIPKTTSIDLQKLWEKENGRINRR